MLKQVVPLICCVLLVTPFVLAQNANSSSTTPPTRVNANKAATRPSQQSTDTVKPSTTAPAARTTKPKPAVTAPPTSAAASPSAGVLAAFNKLLDGIRHANVNAVTNVYWNS